MPERRYHHGDLRTALLSSAERTLAERGPAALSLRELAREAGVSHAAPGRHFRDKRALLDALAVSGFRRLTAVLAAAGSNEQPTHAQLRELARAYVGFARDNAALLDLMYTRKHDSDIPDQLAAAIGDFFAVVLHAITEGQRRGEIIDTDPSTVALTIASALHGYTTLGPDGRGGQATGTHLDEVMDHIYRGISPR